MKGANLVTPELSTSIPVIDATHAPTHAQEGVLPIGIPYPDKGGVVAIVAPVLPTLRLPVPSQKDAHFKSACLLAHRINTDLETGRVHYRTKAGLLLTTLDEVVRALLDHELAGT